MLGARNACLIVAALLLVVGCGVSPLDEERRLEKMEAIADVLSYELDPLEFGETKRCLSENEIRHYRAIDNEHILFSGRRDRLWINKLRSSCPGLRPDSVLVVRKFGGSQICSQDMFEAPDRFGGSWTVGPVTGTGVRCVFGEFQPVTQDQVDEIQKIIDSP